MGDVNKGVAELLSGLSAEELAAAGMGRTWPMLSVKQALASLTIDEALDAFVAAAQRPAGSLVVRKPLFGTREFGERRAAFFSELEAAGGSFDNRPPAVIGESDHRLISHVKRSLYVAAFDSVVTRGRSQLIETAEYVLLDFEGDEFARIDDEIELDSAVLRRESGAVWLIEEPADHTIRVDECFSLLGPNTYAFGHWIVEYLPRLWIAQESGHMPAVPVLIDAGMSRQHRQSLELLLPPGTPIIEVAPMQRVEAKRLWFAPTFYYAPIYPQFNDRFRYDLVAAPPDRFKRIFEGMLERLAATIGETGGDARLYLARKPGSHRKLVNREEIESIAEGHGFERVYLEDLDFIEQLRRIRQARFLLGPEGSAFFMAFFARPGTRACILNHPHTEFLTEVTALIEAVHVDCTVLTGPFERVEEGGYVHFSDYRIDAGVFSGFLDEWVGEKLR